MRRRTLNSYFIPSIQSLKKPNIFIDTRNNINRNFQKNE